MLSWSAWVYIRRATALSRCPSFSETLATSAPLVMAMLAKMCPYSREKMMRQRQRGIAAERRKRYSPLYGAERRKLPGAVNRQPSQLLAIQGFSDLSLYAGHAEHKAAPLGVFDRTQSGGFLSWLAEQSCGPMQPAYIARDSWR